MNTLKVGDKLPNFSLKDQNGTIRCDSDYIGKKIIIFFYPRANTPGCTAEVCDLRDNFKELIDKGYWQNECSNCGYNEENMATGKTCLGVDFKDGDSKNWLLDNIRLLCANCYYSFNAYFPSAKKFCK